MRHFWVLIFSVVLLSGCRDGFRTVVGNGSMEIKEKSINSFDRLEVSGAFKIKMIPSDQFKMVIEADENLHEHIVIDQSDNRLKIKMRNSMNFKSSAGITITIYGNQISRYELAGSSSIQSQGLLSDDNKIELTIAGSGNARLEIKTPETKVNIGGSGEVDLNGKTRDLEVNIAGSGDFKGDQLMSEKVKISIAGSGSSTVFASVSLNISIAGSGDVFYAGKPANIKKSIAGSGNIREL